MQFITIVQDDPAVDTVVGFTGGGQTNSGFVFVSLKPLAERNVSADQVIARLRAQARAGAGRDAVPAGGAGYPRRRPAEQRAVPIHACRPTT